MARLRSRNQPRRSRRPSTSRQDLLWQRQSRSLYQSTFCQRASNVTSHIKRARVAPPPQLNNPHDSLALGGRHIDTSASRSTHTLSRSLTDNITRLSAPLFRSLSRHHARSRIVSLSTLTHFACTHSLITFVGPSHDRAATSQSHISIFKAAVALSREEGPSHTHSAPKSDASSPPPHTSFCMDVTSPIDPAPPPSSPHAAPRARAFFTHRDHLGERTAREGATTPPPETHAARAPSSLLVSGWVFVQSASSSLSLPLSQPPTKKKVHIPKLARRAISPLQHKAESTCAAAVCSFSATVHSVSSRLI